jgi:hypothetical protein
MRDIRSDLQERATLIDEQIRAVFTHIEKTIEQLQRTGCEKSCPEIGTRDDC